MIIQNGTIEFIHTRNGGGIDPATGYPVEPSVEYGELIPCQWNADQYNLLAKTGQGEGATKESYTVLYESFFGCPSGKVRLRDMCGCVMGEFPIRSAFPLDAVCQIRLVL